MHLVSVHGREFKEEGHERRLPPVLVVLLDRHTARRRALYLIAHTYLKTAKPWRDSQLRHGRPFSYLPLRRQAGLLQMKKPGNIRAVRAPSGLIVACLLSTVVPVVHAQSSPQCVKEAPTARSSAIGGPDSQKDREHSPPNVLRAGPCDTDRSKPLRLLRCKRCQDMPRISNYVFLDSPPGTVATRTLPPSPPPSPGKTAPLSCGNQEDALGAVRLLEQQQVWPNKLGALVAGIQLESDFALDQARVSYEKAMDSSDGDVAWCAKERYSAVARLQRGWTWSAYLSPPMTWFRPNRLHGILYSLIIALLFPAIASGWISGVRHGVHLSTPRSLSGDLPTDLFTAEVFKAMRDARLLIEREREGHQMRGSAALSLSRQELPQEVVNALPTVLGVDVGKILPAVLYFYRFFFLKLECGLAFNGTEITCYSTLRRGFRTVSIWTTRLSIPRTTDGLSAGQIPLPGLVQIARRVAYRTAAWVADPALRTA